MHDNRPTVLLTFRSYGTWLHGDERGSVDRNRNTATQSRLPPAPGWEKYERSLMVQPPVFLPEPQRELVTRAISELAESRGWSLYAVNVRTNHVHVVAAVTGEVGRAIPALKAASTLALRDAGMVSLGARVWSRGGSVRMLASERAVKAACRYVIEEQGSELGVAGRDL